MTTTGNVEVAYDLLTQTKSEFQSSSAVAGLQAAYERGENDEFVKATSIKTAEQEEALMQEGDAVIFMNYESRPCPSNYPCFCSKFEVSCNAFPNIHFVMLTQYAADIPLSICIPTSIFENTYGEWLSKQRHTQLRISETEKYAHVTFFLQRWC